MVIKIKKNARMYIILSRTIKISKIIHKCQKQENTIHDNPKEKM
jgi:hypothetical protein